MQVNFVTAATAQNATETTKTKIASEVVPQNVSKLRKIGVQVFGSGITTLESLSFILEIEGRSITPQQFASDTILPLTSGSPVFPAQEWPCDIPVIPGATLDFYTTYNAVLTVTPSNRIFGTYE